MLARLLLSLSLPIFSVIGDEDLQLKCNWAQGFTDFDKLLANEALQKQIMLMASEWEGNFAADDIGVHHASAITNSYVKMNFDTGYATPTVSTFLPNTTYICIYIIKKGYP
jgi:hypothetical protein